VRSARPVDETGPVGSGVSMTATCRVMGARLGCVLVALVLGTAAAADLFAVARSGTAREMASALAAGGDVDEVDAALDTPLLLAVHYNTADVVALLLEAGADPHYANPRTGMGIFGLVWRNPDPAPIRALFAERALVAFVGVRPGAEETRAIPADAASAPTEVAPPVPQAGAIPALPPPALPPLVQTPPVEAPALEAPALEPPSVAAPALPASGERLNADRPTPEAAAELGYQYRGGAEIPRDEVRDWVTHRFALSGPLDADAYVLACHGATLDLMRARETVLFGDLATTTVDDDGVFGYGTYALARSAAGEVRRWSLRCTGFVEDDVLSLWIEIEAR
jgi:hypothetical protein